MVPDADRHVFAVERGSNVDAQIKLEASHLLNPAAVGRTPALGDVHFSVGFDVADQLACVTKAVQLNRLGRGDVSASRQCGGRHPFAE